MVTAVPCRTRYGITLVSDVVGIGEQARLALVRSDGVARPLAEFAEAPYLDAAGEIIWVGAGLLARHPRAVVTGAAPPRAIALTFDPLPERGWSPQLPPLDDAMANAVVYAARRLRHALLNAATPRGFGNLLAGREPEFPLDLALRHVHNLGIAYQRADANAVIAASIALLGFGTGLTPSGDDLTGAGESRRRAVARGRTT